MNKTLVIVVFGVVFSTIAIANNYSVDYPIVLASNETKELMNDLTQSIEDEKNIRLFVFSKNTSALVDACKIIDSDIGEDLHSLYEIFREKYTIEINKGKYIVSNEYKGSNPIVIKVKQNIEDFTSKGKSKINSMTNKTDKLKLCVGLSKSLKRMK